jgi:uncharacterized repeat protein (TIGR02543 family)
LEIDFINDYDPSPGDSFEIVTCGPGTGEFSEIVSNMEGITLVPDYTGTGLTLTVSDGAAPEENVCEIVGGTGYPTLDDVLAVVPSGETIRLLKDIDYDGGIVIEDKRITFDLNGFTLNVVNNAEAVTAEEMSGLFVIGDAAVDLVDLSGAGELNVTGSWYGVYAASTVDETDSVTNNNTSVTVTNALGHKQAGVMANNAKVTVKGNAASDAGGYGVCANFQYAEVSVEGNVTAGGDGCIGVLPNSSAKITVKGSVTVSGYNSIGIKAYDNGEATVEKDITASGTGSVGINARGSYAAVGGNVTGEYGGIYASGSGVDITGDVRSLGDEVNSYGVTASDYSDIDVGGDVRSNGTGANIWSEDAEDSSEITIDGVIEAPEYIQIGTQIFAFTEGYLDPEMIKGYRIYADPSLGAVLVAEFAGGSGTEGDPYLVAHADQLYNLRNHLDKHFRLIEDINLSGYMTGEGWKPIGTSANPFTGTFDGDGKVINNLFISRGTSDYVGLFGYTEKTAEIRNLGLENAGTTGKNFVGSLIGYSMGKIMNSYSAGNVNGSQFVGGLVGYNFREGLSLGGTITSSYSSCTVTAMDFDAGGLAGRNARGVITNSFATGNVSSPVSVGGLVGASVGEVGNKNVGLITNSYATGEVSATVQDAGGLVGQNSALISYSFATGRVSCPNNVGGLAGDIYNWGRTENSYWDTITSGQNASAGGGTGKTTAEMKQQATFENWDFITVWDINASDNNGYPFLAVLTAPTAPQNFTATPSDGQVALSWTAPASDGGSAVTKYQVSKDNGVNWTDAGLNTTHTFTDLTNGTAYTFKVRAVNRAGNGAETSTTATPTATPTPTYAVTVTNGTGGGEFAQGVTVTITANSAPDGQRFKEWQVRSGGITLINSQEASTSFQMPANAVEVAATYETIPETTYTVTVNGSYATATGAGSYAQDVTVTIDAGSRTNYSFNGWTSLDGVTFTNSNSATTTFTMPPSSVTVTANWTYNGGGGSGGDSSTPTTPAAPSYKADVKEGSGAETTIPVTVDKDAGTASVDAGSQGLDQGGTNITIPSIPDVDTYSVGIPVPDLSTSDIQGTLTVNTDAGNITIPSNMLTGVSGISGSKAEIAIGQGDKDNLPDTVKAAIGDRPLLQLSLSIDGKQTDWSNPDAPVTVSISYTPTAAELANPESIVVWYIDGSGNVVSVPNGRYDPTTGMVTFTTAHFSDYAVAYNKVSFNDVAADAWYHKAVSFIAARGITGGTGNGNYSPEARLTRGQFVVMLMKAYGISPDADLKNNFADAGSAYYTGYLAAAKRLSISSGVGNNMFEPEKEITRQEMFTLLYNALKIIGRLPQNDSGKTLSDFTDSGQIDSWAREAMALLVETGTIGGNAGKLNPTSTTTRAEMAQVLYNLLSK